MTLEIDDPHGPNEDSFLTDSEQVRWSIEAAYRRGFHQALAAIEQMWEPDRIGAPEGAGWPADIDEALDEIRFAERWARAKRSELRPRFKRRPWMMHEMLSALAGRRAKRGG